MAGRRKRYWFATRSHDKTVRLWRADGLARATLTGHTGHITAVAIAPDSTWLATAAKDETVRLWNRDGTRRATLRGHAGQVNAVAISPGSDWLVTASADRTVRLWHAGSHECAAILRTDAKLLDVCWQAGNLIAACGPSGIYTLTLTGTTG